jgi:hypothetical protein
MIDWIRSGAWRNHPGWGMFCFPIAVFIFAAFLSTSFLYWLPHFILALLCAPIVFLGAVSYRMVRSHSQAHETPDRHYL